MRQFSLLAVLIILSACGGPDRHTRNLHAIFDEDWEWTLSHNPVWATRLGDDRYNADLPDMSLEAVEETRGHQRAMLERIMDIHRDSLSDEDKLNYDLFRRQLEESIEGHAYSDHLMSLTQRRGPQIGLPRLSQFTKFRNLKDYEDYLTRLGKVPVYMDQVIGRLKAGMETGWVQPREPLRSVPDQIKAQIAVAVDKSPFYKPFTAFPDLVSSDEQARLAAEARRIINDEIKPAFQTFHDFVTETYLPACKDDVGTWSHPNGLDYYAYRARVFTTTSRTPNEIHAIGLSEVARIKAEMMDIVRETGFGTDFDAFTEFLRSDKQFYYTDPDELLRGYRDICKRIDYKLPKLFGHLPRAPYGVMPIPDFEAPASTTAYYNRPAADGSRPGIFYANTYKLEERPKYEMEALSIHEAVPGHHLQLAISMELEGIPNFRRYGGFTAFVEGWGLYSESLGKEMGFYTTPYTRFGQLSYEMWRAVRLVVDTGMHAKQWTRQQAIDFFLENTGLSRHNIIAEVDRYIVWPGQALAYKTGQMKIRELREKAAETLGKTFDIRAFHDLVLGAGALPLDILESRVNDWIVQKQSG